MLMREAAIEYKWNLNNAGIAAMWRGGCIIKSVFLGDITKAFQKNPDLENLLMDDFFLKAIAKAQPGWRRVIAQATIFGIPIPCMASAISLFDGYRSEVVPANLLSSAPVHLLLVLSQPGPHLRLSLHLPRSLPLA